MKHLVRFIFLALLVPIAQAQEPPPGYVLPNTETWDLTSASGEPYRIFVSLPKGEPPKDGFPVMTVLDGNAMFAAFAETRWRLESVAKGNLSQAIIVAVGYPTDLPYDKRRGPDFTSALSDGDPYAPRKDDEKPQAHPGGKDHFLDFLLDRLRPEVARRYAVNPKRQSLFGHSYGGLFALHTLYTRPNAFHSIIAASPSIWFNDQAILAEERAFADQLIKGRITKPSRVFVLVGAEEERFTNTWNAEALRPRLERLSAYGLLSRYELLADEGHNTVPTRAVTPALRFAFGAL